MGPLISPTHCTKITLYQKKPLITPRHPSYHRHTAPKSPCTRKNLLSPLATPHITDTLHQNHPVPENTSYHPSPPLISPTHCTKITLYQKTPLITPRHPSYHRHTAHHTPHTTHHTPHTTHHTPH